MGALSCATRLSAKSLVVLFSAVILCLGITVTALGVLSFAQFHQTFLAGAVPGWVAGITVAIGILMSIFALGGMFGTACCLHKSKKSLCVMGALTSFFMVAFLLATISAFQFSSVVRVAAETGFDDGVSASVKGFYTGLRDAHLNAYVSCNATTYFTDRVRQSCKLAKAIPGNELDVDACAEDAYGNGDRVGMFCRNGPNLEPFSVGRALEFPSTDLTLSSLLRMRSYGYFMSATCMPTQQRYYDLMGELIAANIPGILLPANVNTQLTNSVFGKCYKATWWNDNQGGLSDAEKAALVGGLETTPAFKAQPNGTALTTAEEVFFNGMQLAKTTVDLGNPYLSARLAFCLCADQGANSRLFTFLRDQVFKHIEWICLGLTLFFALTLLAEIYLGCCVKKIDPKTEVDPKAELKLRGWQAGSQGSVGSAQYVRP